MTFYELEKACKRRKIKKILFFSFLFLAIVGILLSIKFLPKKEVTKSPKSVQKKVEKKKKELNKTIVKKVKINVNLNVEKEIFLKPIIEIQDINVTTPVKKYQIVKKIEKNVSKENNFSKNLIFTESITYDFAIKKAKEFYKKGNYEKAIEWAKRANKLDTVKNESWIISAKALYQLGKVNKSIQILNTYLKYYNDSKVKEVLNEINSTIVK